MCLSNIIELFVGQYEAKASAETIVLEKGIFISVNSANSI